MARKVAFSLTASRNEGARGQKMFQKRVLNAGKWVAGERPMDYQDQDFSSESEEEKYYNPNPWQNTWQPTVTAPRLYQQIDMEPASNVWHPPEPGAPPAGPPSYVPPPPLPVPKLEPWMAPKLPSVSDETRQEALSSEEFEKMRLYEEKVLHNKLPPQIAFSLADDLRQMKGRGGKLFAKRRAKAETWVVEDKTNTMPRPNKDMMQKLAAQSGAEMPAPPPKNYRNTAPTNRLASMINKPAMSPWDAAAEHGSIDLAFGHLQSSSSIIEAAKSNIPPPFKFTPSKYDMGDTPKSWGADAPPARPVVPLASEYCFTYMYFCRGQ